MWRKYWFGRSKNHLLKLIQGRVNWMILSPLCALRSSVAHVVRKKRQENAVWLVVCVGIFTSNLVSFYSVWCSGQAIANNSFSCRPVLYLYLDLYFRSSHMIETGLAFIWSQYALVCNLLMFKCPALKVCFAYRHSEYKGMLFFSWSKSFTKTQRTKYLIPPSISSDLSLQSRVCLWRIQRRKKCEFMQSSQGAGRNEQDGWDVSMHVHVWEQRASCTLNQFWHLMPQRWQGGLQGRNVMELICLCN